MLWRAAPALVVLTLAPTAMAQSHAQDRSLSVPTFTTGLGLQAALGGNNCEHGGDVISCTNNVLFSGLQLHSSLRFARHFGVGVVGSVSGGGDRTESFDSSYGSTSTSHSLYRGSVVATVHPWVDRGFWAGVEGGVAAIYDARSGGAQPSFSTTQSAPLVGAALGWDLELSRSVVLGLEYRQLYAAFKDDSEVTDGWSYGRWWSAAGVTLAYRSGL